MHCNYWSSISNTLSTRKWSSKKNIFSVIFTLEVIFPAIQEVSNCKISTAFYGLLHCVKNVQIHNFFWSIFSSIPTEFRDLQRNLHIQSEYRKILTRKNSTFGHSAMEVLWVSLTKYPVTVKLNLLSKNGGKLLNCKVLGIIHPGYAWDAKNGLLVLD